MRELTFNITEDKRYLVEPTNVENFNLTFDKPNWVQGRVGEDSLRQVFVNVVTGPNNEPYDLTGINPEFDGLTAKGGPENRNYVVIDNHHSVMIDAQGGRFRFDFPKEAFAIAGSYKQAFFSLKREGTGEVVATLEFDMKVMANFVYENVVAFDYVTPFEDLYHQLEQIIETANGDITSKLAEWQTTFQNKYNELEQLGIHTTDLLTEVQSRLNDLAEQIESKGLITKLEAQQLVAPLASKTDVDAMGKTKVTKFETLNDLKQADLSVGQLVVTLHGWNSNDSDGAHYIISNNAGDGAVQLNNGLFASRYEIDWDIYYDESEIKNDWKNINHTIVNEVFVKQKDNHGNYIVPRVVNTYSNAKNPDDYALKNQTSLTINAALTFCTDSNGHFVHTNDPSLANWWLSGAVVGNGQVLHEIDSRTKGTLPSNFTYIGFKENGGYGNYPANDWDAAQMISNGVKDAFLTYAKIVTNGAAEELSNFKSNETPDASYLSTHNNRIAIGFKDDGTMVVVTSDGLSISNRGLTVTELVNELVSLNVVDAWLVDGGGSTSVVLRGARLNGIKDTHNGLKGTEARGINYSLSFKKPIATNGVVATAVQSTRYAQQSLINQLELMRYTYDSNRIVSGGDYTINSDDEIESVLDSIKNHIPTDTFSPAVIVVGYIRVQYRNSAIFSALGNNLADNSGMFRYTMHRNTSDGEWTYHWIELVNTTENEKIYNIWSPRSNKWLGWHGEGVAHWINATIKHSSITNLQVLQGQGGIVEVIGTTTVSAAPKSWTLLGSGLPPVKYTINADAITLDTTLRNALKTYVDSNGSLYGRYIQYTDDQSRDLTINFTFSYPTSNAISYTDQGE